MKCPALTLLIAFSLSIGISPAKGAEPFEFKDGDRVVLIGNTLIEREQRYGYWETAITARYPKRNITFRNLGWSGDTVFGDAQAGFGTAADGFKHLVDHVLALKPTVIIMGYGGVEAFEGEKGLKRFEEGLNKLLEAVASTKARVILLAPIPMENLEKPFPDPDKQNKNVKLYAEVIRQISEKNSYLFVDLFDLTNPKDAKRSLATLTDDELHLSGYGYWVTGYMLTSRLTLSTHKTLDPTWKIEIDSKGKVQKAKGTTLERESSKTIRLKAIDEFLPKCLAPEERPNGSLPFMELRAVWVKDEDLGEYSVSVDGKKVIMIATGTTKDAPHITEGPEFDQVEKLRRTIIEKNRLYFHRWRPQNETYLFGFRKHEQGQNAREIPQFDPLIEKLEKEIATLRVPVTHTYEIVPAK